MKSPNIDSMDIEVRKWGNNMCNYLMMRWNFKLLSCVIISVGPRVLVWGGLLSFMDQRRFGNVMGMFISTPRIFGSCFLRLWKHSMSYSLPNLSCHSPTRSYWLGNLLSRMFSQAYASRFFCSLASACCLVLATGRVDWVDCH